MKVLPTGASAKAGQSQKEAPARVPTLSERPGNQVTHDYDIAEGAMRWSSYEASDAT